MAARRTAKRAAPVDNAGAQCPKPGPCGDGYAIMGKMGAHAGEPIAYFCVTHGRNELVVHRPEPEPLTAEEQKVVDAHAPLITEAEARQTEAEANYEAAVQQWADASLALQAAERADAEASWSAQYSGRRVRHDPGLGVKARAAQSDARRELDDRERELSRARGAASRAIARAEAERRVARDKAAWPELYSGE